MADVRYTIRITGRLVGRMGQDLQRKGHPRAVVRAWVWAACEEFGFGEADTVTALDMLEPFDREQRARRYVHLPN